jgi:signal transduction histidine kinase
VAAIVVVGAADIASTHAAVREGAAGYLMKPVDSVALVLGVERALETRALRRELDALRARREQLATEARRSLRAREALFATVAHDVRAQLAAVTMVTSSLTRGDLPDEHRKRLALVPRAVKRIERVVGDLLDIGRLEAGKLPLDLELVRASPLVEDVAGLLQPIAAERRVSVTTSASDFEVRCARPRIVQALERLGSSAVRGTPRNGAIRLRAELRDDRGWFVVEGGAVDGARREDGEPVLDQSGIGASDEAASIDLAIAKRIIEAHGGTLEVESHDGRTMLRFDLPLSGPSAAAAASTVAGKDASAASW